MKGYRALYILSLLGTILYNVMQLTVPYVSQKIIDLFLSGEQAVENLATKRDLFWELVIAMVVLTFVRTSVVYLSCMGGEVTSQKALYRIRTYLFDKIERQDMHFYATYRTGDLMTRLSGDVDWCRHFASYLFYVLLECFVRFGVTLAFLMSVNRKLALALLAVAPLLLGISALYTRTIRPKFVKMRDRMAAMNTAAQENIAGNKTVKAFAREEYEKDRFREQNEAYRQTNLEINKCWLSFYPGIDFLSNAMTLITIFFGAYLIMEGELTYGGLTVFTSLSWALSSPMGTLGGTLNDLQRFSSSADKVIEVYYARPIIVDRTDAVSHPQPRGEVEFRHVDFSYRTEKVLDDVSFKVEAGKTLAVMGATGSGKTTITGLLSRMYDAKGGEVLVDGCNVRLWKLDELRRTVAEALQDVFLFSDTIASNIAFGVPTLTRAQIAEFARRAGAREFIERMPQRYETVVGERGVGLSGGQRQRIALARAMAMRAPVLVLDDTTSALDSETEEYIRTQLRELPYACTKIIIAQRISSVRDADEIIVLDHGHI